MTIHMIKLVVGVETLSEFAAIVKRNLFTHDGMKVSAVRTRHKPKREGELLESGSIYRVIKGRIECRQRIVGFEEGNNAEYGDHCLILVEPDIIRTVAAFHRPFQGWRYLQPKDAPRDRGLYDPANDDDIPAEMAAELQKAGLL